MIKLNETHDPNARSWVESANGHPDFPIQNLPYCVFSAGEYSHELGVAIGEFVLPLPSAQESFMRSQPDDRMQSRAELFRLLRYKSESKAKFEKLLIPMADVEFHTPNIGDYTDFYASIFHATNVGSMFRPDNPLLPNYKWIPIAYHGRASSIVPTGTAIRRPQGQTREGDAAPTFGPSKRLDYELEVGMFVGEGNSQGEPIPIGKAWEHIFGYCLVNDWSARDVQTWEYQPLGPFLAKNFATTISPWIVTTEALAPFRVPAFQRAEGDPAPLPYLHSDDDQQHGGIDITLEVWLSSAKMREQRIAPQRLSRGSFRNMYWTPAQMLAHHASNGCNLQPGDLLASGTVSGPEKDSRGCLLELTWRGSEPITLPSGEQRRFLEDGDEVVMRGYCEREGFARIGFGECRGTILPAV